MIALPIPVTIVTGFLGSGKTTLLNRLLKLEGLSDTAVIVNEFGEVGIDHLLVEESSDGVIELADGCICCTVRGELVDTLADLIDRVQTERIASLRRVIVETTGLADPVPVLQSLMAHPVLLHTYSLDGVVTTVDAVNGGATLDAHVEAVRQVAVADRLVLTKTDLADAAEIAALRARLRALNPGAAIVEAALLDLGALLGLGLYDPASKTADVSRWLAEAPHGEHDHHSHAHGDHAHDHAHHHNHDDRIRTFSLVHPHPLPYATVEMFLDLLRSTSGERLLRMKGIIEIAEDPGRPVVIHGVQKLLHPPARLAAWPEGPRGARLVLIAIDLSEDYVRRLFDAFTGTPAVDMPDRQALSDNPLAIGGAVFNPAR